MMCQIQNFKYIFVGYKISKNQYKYKSTLFKLLVASFKMLLFLFFLHLIKYSQRKLICLTVIIHFFLFPYISSDFCFMHLCFFVVRCLMVYDVYLLCEVCLLPSKLFIFVSFFKK